MQFTKTQAPMFDTIDAYEQSLNAAITTCQKRQVLTSMLSEETFAELLVQMGISHKVNELTESFIELMTNAIATDKKNKKPQRTQTQALRSVIGEDLFNASLHRAFVLRKLSAEERKKTRISLHHHSSETGHVYFRCAIVKDVKRGFTVGSISAKNYDEALDLLPRYTHTNTLLGAYSTEKSAISIVGYLTAEQAAKKAQLIPSKDGAYYLIVVPSDCLSYCTGPELGATFKFRRRP